MGSSLPEHILSPPPSPAGLLDGASESEESEAGKASRSQKRPESAQVRRKKAEPTQSQSGKKKQVTPSAKEIAGKRKVSAEAQVSHKPKKPKLERQVIPKRVSQESGAVNKEASQERVQGGKLRILSQFLQGISSIASSLLQESENDASE